MKISDQTVPVRTRRPGRPRSFDRDEVLHRAMLTFWRHGYETTSVADLTAAMGITTPSLYATFGDKKRLFLAAVARYAGDPAVLAGQIADAPSAIDAARDMMHASASAFTGETTPPGCLLASATASGSAESEDVRRVVAAFRATVVAALAARIARDVAAGILPATVDAAALARMVVAVIQGMSVLARDGVGRDDLVRLGDAALAGWPRG